MADEQPPTSAPGPDAPSPEEVRAYDAGFICGMGYIRYNHDHDVHSDPTVSAGYALGWFWRALGEPEIIAAPKSVEEAVARVSVIAAFSSGFRDAYNAAHGQPQPGDEGEGGVPPSGGDSTKPKDDGLPSMYN